MPYATVNQIQLYYQEAGEGTPIVYIHGGFAGLDTVLRENAWDWERNFSAFFRFITYDRRGCARSDSPDTGYDLVTQARDLAGLLDVMDIPTAHIMGSSAGGPIAMYFAALYPQRTRSIILVGTAPDIFPVGEPGSDAVRNQLVILEREGADAAFDLRPAGIEVTFNELWDEPEAIARGKLDLYRSRMANYRAQANALPREKRVHYYATELRSMQAYMTNEIYGYAQAITAPTYILQGRNDQMVPLKDAQNLARVISSSQLLVVDGGSHSLMSTSPFSRDRVMDWVRHLDGQTEN